MNLAVPSGVWILLPGTEWEVLQSSGNMMTLGEDATPVLIRRASVKPTIWGPRPPITSIGQSTGAQR